MVDESDITFLLPAKNEAQGLHLVLDKLNKAFPQARVIVVNDGSTDETESVAKKFGAEVVNHVYSTGNGAAIKTGLRIAETDWLLCMDADGQHDVDSIRQLIDKASEGFDMVVGARSHKSQASVFRLLGNWIYNRLASWVVGHRVMDLTSGFRLVKRKKFLEFINLLPNGFSYPTTITMAFFKAGYSIGYQPVDMPSRIGKSHLSVAKDGVRFLLIIFKIGTLYSPLKLFTPISLMFFLTGISYYLYTFIHSGRFTNMSALLLSISVLIFLMGLISEQVTSLMYSQLGGPRGADVHFSRRSQR